jgi:hypothetical protein
MMTLIEATKKLAFETDRPVSEIMRDIQRNAWSQGMTDACCTAIQKCDVADMAACLRITEIIKTRRDE